MGTVLRRTLIRYGSLITGTSVLTPYRPHIRLLVIGRIPVLTRCRPKVEKCPNVSHSYIVVQLNWNEKMTEILPNLLAKSFSDKFQKAPISSEILRNLAGCSDISVRFQNICHSMLNRKFTLKSIWIWFVSQIYVKTVENGSFPNVRKMHLIVSDPIKTFIQIK